MENQDLIQTEATIPSGESTNPITEPDNTDNSHSNESDNPTKATAEASEDNQDSQNQSPKENLVAKHFKNEDKDKIDSYLKKMYGDVDLSDLTEREVKALKSGYHAEKALHEKSQKLAEYEKSQKDTEYSQTKEVAEQGEKQVQQWHQGEIQKLDNVKAGMISNYTDQLLQAGYSGQALSQAIAQYTANLDVEYRQVLQQFDTQKQAYLNQTKEAQSKHFNSQKEQSFSKAEEKLKDKLGNEEYKYLFDQFKGKYSNADDLVDFIPVIEKMIELRDQRLSKTKQINTQKGNISNSQKGTGSSSKGGNNPDNKVQELLGDDEAFNKMFRF
jgi:hypothetical protein